MEQTVGSFGWTDLTVPDAGPIRDFYSAVIGWTVEPVSMGEYDDYVMVGEDGPVTGVCHSRGVNAKIPPVWLVYINVASVNDSIAKCLAGQGKLLDGPKPMEGKFYAILQDPQGAPFAIAGPA